MIRINLAPVEARGRRAGPALPSFNLGVLFGILALVALAGVGYMWYLRFAEETRLAREIGSGEDELRRLKDKLGQGANIKVQLAEVKGRVQVIEQVTKDQDRPLRMLDTFADMVPKELWITSIEDKGSGLKIGGAAYSAAIITEFMTNLKASGKFKEIDIVISKQDLARANSPVTFEVTCRYES
jgi:type IV pilus assembly protein PilN